MEVIVKEFSGLGNQLFQYAAGRYYADLYHAKLRLVLDPPHRAVSRGEFPRPYLLAHFKLAAEGRTVTVWDRLMLSQDPKIRGVTAPLKRILGVHIVSETMAQRYLFLPLPTLRSGVRTLYLLGYWQTYHMVERVSKELRQEFLFKEEAIGKNWELLRRIQDTTQSVSLHIRRGDFALAVEGNIVLPQAYYTEAISLIRERLSDPTFFVFSDDVPFAREFLPKNIRKVFIDHNDHFSSHEDLRLMSSCENHIIANSTFSWWGAWLNARAPKIVVAPRHWLLTKQSYYPDLLPPEWLLVDTNVR